ncbi:MAG: ABATE domain-containing protein [Candidatus Bathyarchaeota archaeon]
MTEAARFKLLGGTPCLDFANTVDWRKGEPRELLNSVHDLIDWARQAGVIPDADAEILQEAAKRDPGEAEALLRRALSLRETIHRLFKAAAEGEDPDQRDLEHLNEELAQALSHMKLTRIGPALTLQLQGDAAEKILWTLAHSAAQLLASPSLTRVKECDDLRCGWLFLDTSRNGTRRWCSMDDCGNRNKARRHHQRKTS